MNNNEVIEVLEKILNEYNSTLQALPKTLAGESWINDRIEAVNIAINTIQKSEWNELPCRLPEDFRNVQLQFKSGNIMEVIKIGKYVINPETYEPEWIENITGYQLNDKNIIAWRSLGGELNHDKIL